MLVLGVLPRPWAWRRDCGCAAVCWLARGASVVGCGLMIWILVEITIIPLDALQPAFGVVGVLIFVAALLRPVRRYFGVALPGEAGA